MDSVWTMTFFNMSVIVVEQKMTATVVYTGRMNDAETICM